MTRRMADHPRLTQARLKHLFHYNPNTGVFTRLVAQGKRHRAGDIAGGVNALGYVQIGVDHVIYLAHRLAWLYMTGDWPRNGEIDHRDLDKTNNAWGNLRNASRRQNNSNRVPQRNNTSGYKGVAKCGAGFRAYITVNGKQRHLGCAPTAEAAHALRAAEAVRQFGEFAREHGES